MKLGEIFKWQTDKAKGHETRQKYHIFICNSDGQNFFLFISSLDWFQDYKLVKSPEHEFLDYDSYVSCSSVIPYSDAELSLFDSTPVGQLTPTNLKELRDALIAAETMPMGDLNIVCKALAAAL
jgi:hypothetical protein